MNPLANLTACLAVVSLIASPVAAAELPIAPRSVTSDSIGFERANQFEVAGWGDRRRHRRGGIDTGDVIAGVLVIGAIAAIAGEARSNRRQRDRERYDEPPEVRRTTSSSSIDRAVDMCVDQVERGNDRVESVENAARVRDGWRVAGELSSGEGWNCWIDNDGRIREIGFGQEISHSQDGDPYNSASADLQLSDEAYASARAAQGTQQPRVAQDPVYSDAIDGDLEERYANDPRPAYPGGPLPGEEGYAEAIGG